MAADDSFLQEAMMIQSKPARDKILRNVAEQVKKEGEERKHYIPNITPVQVKSSEVLILVVCFCLLQNCCVNWEALCSFPFVKWCRVVIVFLVVSVSFSSNQGE